MDLHDLLVAFLQKPFKPPKYLTIIYGKRIETYLGQIL